MKGRGQVVKRRHGFTVCGMVDHAVVIDVVVVVVM
jgi:hypothetical protein